MAMHFYGKFFADFVFHETDGVCDYGELGFALLDPFEVAIDPQNGKAAVIYTDDTLTTSNDPNNFACSSNRLPPCPLSQAVLAQHR
jgi:hypothetical protein